MSYDNRQWCLCLSLPYLVLLCPWREALDLGGQLNEHVCDGGDPGVQVNVLAVLAAEVRLVALTLLQSDDAGVFPKNGGQDLNTCNVGKVCLCLSLWKIWELIVLLLLSEYISF